MITDFALQFNGKYLNMLNYINKLENIGINTEQVKIELTQIITIIQNEIENIKDKHESYIINIYIKGIKELDIFENKLVDKYGSYIKMYNYALYLKSLDIIKDNLDEVVSSLIKVIDMMHNSSNINYEEEKLIVETVYEAIYKVIKSEIIINGNSKIYDYTEKIDVDSYYLHNLVKKELDGIDLDEYPDIKRLIYKINSSDLNSNYFDIELIKEIIFRDKKEELILSVKNNIENLTTKINNNVAQCIKLENQITACTSNKIDIKEKIVWFKKDIAKRIIALSLASSVPIGSFIGLKSLFTFVAGYNYDVTTKTYNSYFDNTETNTESIYLSNISIEYNNRVVVKRCFPYEMTEEPYREVEIYYLPYNENYELKDYISYIDDKNILPNKEIEKKEDNSINYSTDYFEVVYQFIDLESKHISNLDVSLIYFFSMFLTFFITVIESLLLRLLSDDINNMGFYKPNISKIIYDIYEIKDSKESNKEETKKIINNVKLLMDAINEDAKLRTLFNNELSKYPELVENINGELMKYKPEVDAAKLVKKLGKKTI